MALFLHLLAQYGYLALFFLVLIGGTYVPIPAGVILVAVGVLSHHHHYFILTLSFLVALAGSLTDDGLTYAFARWVGKKEKYLAFARSNRYAGYIEEQFGKHPALVVAASRFIGFASMPVNALAGLTRMDIFEFLFAAGIGDGICIAAYLAIGYTVGSPWAHDIHTALVVLTYLIAISSIVSLVFFFISHSRK
ncbi:MAG TPA: VTT domain-containing protein [Candidatus Paceibacterota bacterium]|jgi:membrane protein DedA with SNARE-associated domain|nr:VTT domain-containing protein [Candidatus Paceibacterota bacterium]